MKAPESLVVLLAAAFVLVRRGRWVSCLTDFGIWMSDFGALARGGRPLRDVRLAYGPGSLWILRGAERVLGVRVGTLVALDFAVGLAVAVLTIRFCRPFVRERERWLSALVLGSVVLLMPGSGCLLYPYAPAATLALLFLLLALFAGFPVGAPATGGRWALAFVLAGACYLTKQEVGLAALAGLGAAEIGVRGWRGLVRAGVGAVIAAVVVAGGYAWAARGSDFFALAKVNHLWPFAPVAPSWARLYAALAGYDDPLRSFERMAAGTAAAAAAIGAAAALWGEAAKEPVVRRRGIFLGAYGAVVAAVLLAFGDREFPVFAASPVILALAIPLAWRRRRTTPREIGLLVPAVLLLLRAGLRGWLQGPFAGLGLVLSIPFISRAIVRPRGLASGRGGARFARAWCALLLTAFAAFAALRLARLARIDSRLVPFSSPRGRVWLPPDWARAASAIGTAISAAPRSEPVAILPETHGLDFLFERANASPVPNLVPGIIDDALEAEILGRWRVRPPAVFVVFEYPYEMLGSRGFGRDFGLRLSRWIREHAEQIAAPSPGEIPYSVFRTRG